MNDARAMSEIDPASETTKKQKILGLFVPSTVPKIISILELLEILHRTSMLLQSRENAAKIEKSDAMLKNAIAAEWVMTFAVQRENPLAPVLLANHVGSSSVEV